MSDDRGSKDNPSGKAVSGTSRTETGGSAKAAGPKATTLPPVDKLASARKTLIGISGPPSGAPPSRPTTGAPIAGPSPKSMAPMRPSVPSGPTPGAQSTTALKTKPQSIQPPAQAHEADDWDADEATTIFNPKAMLRAARNASGSQSKAESPPPAQPQLPETNATPNDVSPDPPSKTTVVDASTSLKRPERETDSPSHRDSSVGPNPVARSSSHRVGSHAEKTSPSTRAFAAVQRASAKRADHYVWIAAGAFVIAGAWFALRSEGDSTSKRQPTPSASMPTSTAPLLAGSLSSSTAPSASRGSDAQGIPEANVAAAAEQKTSSNDLVVVTIVASPAQARFYYKGKPVGRSPLRVELKPGERRSFELGLPGYQTRKVIVDGTQADMKVTMAPEAPATAGSSESP